MTGHACGGLRGARDARRVEPERAAKSVSQRNHLRRGYRRSRPAGAHPVAARGEGLAPIADGGYRRAHGGSEVEDQGFPHAHAHCFPASRRPSSRAGSMRRHGPDARGGVRRHRLSPDRDRRRRSRRCRTRRSRRSRRSRGRARKRAAEGAIEKLRERFGDAIVKRGIVLRGDD